MLFQTLSMVRQNTQKQTKNRKNRSYTTGHSTRNPPGFQTKFSSTHWTKTRWEFSTICTTHFLSNGEKLTTIKVFSFKNEPCKSEGRDYIDELGGSSDSCACNLSKLNFSNSSSTGAKHAAMSTFECLEASTHDSEKSIDQINQSIRST